MARDLLSLSLAGVGCLAEAADEFRAALAIDPGNAEIRSHLAAIGSIDRTRE